MNCKLCDGSLEVMIDLGRLPLANDLLDPDNPQEVAWFDGVWAWCDACQLLQLTDPPDPSLVYTESYPYLSGTSRYMDWHFKKTAQYLFEKYRPRKVCELAVNDGGLLQFLPEGVSRLGIEPMRAAHEILEQKRIPHLFQKFDKDTGRIIRESTGQYDLVFMANTIRSLPDLADLFIGVERILKSDGVFVFEEPYIVDIVSRGEYDQFYSEHIWGLTIASVDSIAKRYGFGLIDIDILPVNHGGSLRYHLVKAFSSKQRNGAVDEYAKIIGESRLADQLREWQAKIDRNIDEFASAVMGSVRTIGYAATAKSVTILNYAYNKGYYPLVSCVYDTTPTKWNKLLPGVRIPIYDAKMFREDNSDLTVLWAYNHKREIMSREKGRKWLLTFPEVHTEES